MKQAVLEKRIGFDGNMRFGDVNKGASQRRLINPDELIKLDNNKLIIIIRGKKPLMAYKYDYSNHNLAKEVEEIIIEQYKEKLDIERIIVNEIERKSLEEKPKQLPTFEDFLRGRRQKK